MKSIRIVAKSRRAAATRRQKRRKVAAQTARSVLSARNRAALLTARTAPIRDSARRTARNKHNYLTASRVM